MMTDGNGSQLPATEGVAGALQVQPTAPGAGWDMEKIVAIRADRKAHPRVADTPAGEAKARMVNIVLKACLYAGRNETQDFIDFTAGALVSQIAGSKRDGLNLSVLSWEEVDLAMTRAVLNGETYGINVASLYSAVRRYALGAGHEASARALALSGRNPGETDPETAKRFAELAKKMAKALRHNGL